MRIVIIAFICALINVPFIIINHKNGSESYKLNLFSFLFCLGLAIICLASQVNAANTTPEEKERSQEVFYVKSWCEEHNGHQEFRMSDMVRIDCLTETEAIEFDWAHKWYEAIGQSLYYGMLSWKQPAIVLIVGHDMDNKFVERAAHVIEYYKLPVHVYVISKEK